ncbi:GntR family transcriptional regulator [Paramagnetospirillum kuznetsovii]|uniref:GntR family transcriptional regulator n=1 Tax=Paramagnetospirillum kuznetsovii TaxID=2053833 RepID=A0A364NYH5_9PROT|nr:GntR family transcriptional regulator [Paramagnetospirillum kuznetsovii]RAU22122.1 GntR family transcriptional regulator [Paramagnetospirillum kuznetsovii]
MTVAEDKLSKALQARQLLMSDICVGRLRPGDRIIEEDIAARVGCSRTPVREAIHHLDAIGMLLFKPRHGAVVAKRDQKAETYLRDALAELESVCAALAARRVTAEQRGQLGRLMKTGAPEGDLLDALHTATGNPVLVDLTQDLRARLLSNGPPETVGASLHSPGLGHVVEAVISGDAAAARAAMQAHMHHDDPPQLP